MRERNFSGWTALLAAALVAAGYQGCTRRLTDSAQCAYNSDCVEGLSCVLGRCRAGCQQDRDCPMGQRCATEFMAEPGITGSNMPACVPAQEHYCLYDSDCVTMDPMNPRCLPDRLCGVQCLRDPDCANVAGGRTQCQMSTQSCVVPGTSTDAGGGG